MKWEIELDHIVACLRNNPTDEEAERAADLIMELRRELSDSNLMLEKSSQDYWSK
jgi:hypothetical protein